ncbi:MAG: hypothetical protein CVV27_03960 [Candidatus Melainabacteria bacterium HGW-Melainabacteria-1]|nr:MAG: hypothetical protein CVV27_03960 [Candidatus Melainabacteria bacterium HGW-Melainabacteria-1]
MIRPMKKHKLFTPLTGLSLSLLLLASCGTGPQSTGPDSSLQAISHVEGVQAARPTDSIPAGYGRVQLRFDLKALLKSDGFRTQSFDYTQINYLKISVQAASGANMVELITPVEVDVVGGSASAALNVPVGQRRVLTLEGGKKTTSIELFPQAVLKSMVNVPEGVTLYVSMNRTTTAVAGIYASLVAANPLNQALVTGFDFLKLQASIDALAAYNASTREYEGIHPELIKRDVVRNKIINDYGRTNLESFELTDTSGSGSAVAAFRQLSGTVTGLPAGKLVRLTVSDTSSKALQLTTSNNQPDSFSIDRIVPGQYKLMAHVDGYFDPTPVNVDLSSDVNGIAFDFTGQEDPDFTPVGSAPNVTSNAAISNVGDVYVIAGTGFGASQGNSFVQFNSIKATDVTAWSDSSISVRVPPFVPANSSVSVHITGKAAAFAPNKFTSYPTVRTVLTPGTSSKFVLPGMDSGTKTGGSPPALATKPVSLKLMSDNRLYYIANYGSSYEVYRTNWNSNWFSGNTTAMSGTILAANFKSDGPKYDGFPATQSSIQAHDIDFDSSGNLYASEKTRRDVRFVNSASGGDGLVYTFSTLPGNAVVTFLAVDKTSGEVYVTSDGDGSNGSRIYRIDTSGGAPADLATGFDYRYPAVQVAVINATPNARIGSMDIDDTGRLYVSDVNGGKIIRLIKDNASDTGYSTEVLKSNLSFPGGLDVNGAGNQIFYSELGAPTNYSSGRNGCCGDDDSRTAYAVNVSRLDTVSGSVTLLLGSSRSGIAATDDSSLGLNGEEEAGLSSEGSNNDSNLLPVWQSWTDLFFDPNNNSVVVGDIRFSSSYNGNGARWRLRQWIQ